jgi:hypothetical protein
MENKGRVHRGEREGGERVESERGRENKYLNLL